MFYSAVKKHLPRSWFFFFELSVTLIPGHMLKFSWTVNPKHLAPKMKLPIHKNVPTGMDKVFIIIK